MGLSSFLFGDKAKAPQTIELEDFEFNPADVSKSQSKALASNLDALKGDLPEVIDRVNEIGTEQALKIREAVLPGFSQFQSGVGSLLSQLTEGGLFGVPDDFKDLLKTEAAERGISRGTSGSLFDDFSFLKNFGKESLAFGLQKASSAGNLLSQLVATAPNVNALSPANLLISPGAVFNADVSDARFMSELDAKQKTIEQQIKQAAENARVEAENANRKGGFLSGAISGGIQGFMTGGPIGAVVGAGVGGVSSRFGGSNANTAGKLGEFAGKGVDKISSFFNNNGGGDNEFKNPIVIKPFNK